MHACKCVCIESLKHSVMIDKNMRINFKGEHISKVFVDSNFDHEICRKILMELIWQNGIFKAYLVIVHLQKVLLCHP